jgi:hypothetical protein
LSKGKRLRRKRAQQSAQEPASPAAIKFTGTPAPVYLDGLTTDIPIAIDMRDGQPHHLDMNLRHAPDAEGRSVQASSIYIGGYGPDFRRCPCGMEGVHRNRACPKCGLTLKDSATLPTADGTTRSVTGNHEGYKEEAIANELAASVIRNRRVEIRNVKLDADGVIRNKHFHDCDIIGPAILLLIQKVDFIETVFSVADDTIESIIWPPNPAATRVLGIIGVDHCRFEGGQFINIGFTGTPEVLNALRRIGSMRPPK